MAHLPRRPPHGDQTAVDEGSSLDLSSLDPNELMVAKGVIVEELVEGVDEKATGRLVR